MPDKKYLIEIPDMPEGSGIWDADKWERNKDTFMADYPEANVFELGDYDENDSRETDQIMLSFEDNEELSGIWDSAKWERNKEAFVQDYPEAKVNRVRYVDYWGDAARQNRARREELNQPDVERDARLAEIGYFDDISGEQKQFDVNAPATMGLKPVSSAIRQNSVSGETEYLDPRVAEFYANDTAYTDKLAERARLDAEYEENPSVIARREYDAQLARYADDLKKQIESDMESDVDKGKLAKGFARKNMPGTATAYATSGNLGKDTIGERLENEKYERYSTAVKLLDKAKIARDVAGKGFGGAVIDWAKEGFMDKTTQSDIEAYNEIGNILSRIEKEVGSLKAENITEEVFDKYLSKDEQALIKAFFEYNSAMAEAQQDMSGWYKGGKIFAESIPFMLEFLATGGLYKTAGKAATRGLEKALVKWITKSTGKSVAAVGRKVLSSNAIGLTRALAGTAARTLVSPGTYDRLAEASLEIDGEGHLNRAKNAAISLADSYVENLSEISGGLIGKGLGYLGKGAGKLAKTIGGAPLSKIGSWLGDQKLVQGLVKGWTTAAPKLEMLGFHGLPEEIGEEFIGNTIRDVAGIQPGALEEMVADDNFGAMLIGFAPMTLLGAAGGAVSIGVVNAKASKLGNEIREMFSDHYDTQEIDSIMQALSGATTAKEIKEMLKPMEASVMDALSRGMITQEQAIEEIEMLYQYGGFIAQNNALLFGQQARENELATAKRAEMADRYGRFWQQDETETVEVATLNNGNTVFVTSAPAEDGKITIVDAVTGKKGFANTSDIVTREVDGKQIQATNKMSMAAFLNGQIAMQRKTEEETRMANERNAQIDALRAQVTPGTRINLGTEGSPVYVFAKKVGANGVTVVDETGMETLLGWDQAADALGQPIVVETDQQKLDAEISARLQRMAERRMQRGIAPATQIATVEAAQESAEVVAQEQKHIPLNEDGTVNEAAFWTQDPEGYVQWNDEQNKDGGQDSLRQIAIAKQELIAMLAEVAAGQNTSNPTMRKAAEKEVAIIQDKIARLEAMEQRYAETLVENVKQTAATPTATMSEEQLEQMDAQYQGILSMTRVPSEIVRVMQEYLNKLAEGSVPVVLLTKQNYEEKLKEDNIPNAIIKRVKDQVEAGKSVAGFMARGKVYLMSEGIISIDEARVTYVHERQHTFNSKNPELVQRVADALGSEENALAVLKAFVGELALDSYKDDDLNALADEIICRSMEIAYTTEEFSVDLQSKGVPSEVISIITEIDNEQRKDQSLSHARRRRERNSHADVPGAGSVQEDGRNIGQVSEGVLEQEETRSSGVSGRGAQIGEGTEPGEVEPEALLDETGFEVDEENEDVRFSVRYLPTPEQRNGIIDSIVKVTGQPRDVAERWLDSELSLASIVLNDKEYLDYAPDAKYKAIKDNSDYPQGTVDFNNICRKRKDFTRMYTRLQRSYPNRIFTAEDLADIRTVMSEDGLTVACGLCYVEDRRQKLGEVANAFIEDLQDGFRNYAKKNATKKANAAQFLVLVSGDNYIPSIYDLITLEGSDKLYEEHRGIWEAFGAYNRARGQQTQNTFQGYAEYKREILTWSDAKVKKVNSLGGLRIFSYSDFEAHHLLDIIQIIIDCAARGMMIQGYTKVPEFARVVEKTGIKLNRSLIPLGDTGIVDGKLAYDPVEGIDINDSNFLESNDNVGNILIGINDEQIRLAMADPFIHYIIPYHARQAGNIRAKLNVGAWTNYIDTQNERKMSDGKRVEKNINIYTDVLDESITNDREFVEKYLEVCREKGYIPKFDQFLDKDADGNYVYTPGYYKFLVDFKLFDEAGNILPQKPVIAEFDDAFNAQILNDYSKEERETTGAAMNSTYDKIVETLDLGEPTEGEDVRFKIGEDSVDILEEARKIVEREDAKESDVRMRITPEMDKAYMDAVEAGDMETAQRMVDEAAAAAGYTIRGDHGRVSKFTIFDRNKANPEGNWGQGFYFSNNEEDVENNYATFESPDLEAKIEREVERRINLAEMNEEFDEDGEVDEFTIREEVEDEFITSEPNVVHAAIKMDNPFVVGHGMVEIGEDGLGHYDMQETYLTAEYETDEDGEIDYDFEPTGTLVDLVEALNNELSGYEWANVSAYDILSNNIDGMTASQFEIEARELLSPYIDSLVNDNGETMSSEIIRAAIERAGFDGIVDNTVNQKFGTARRYGRSMDGVDSNTRHYVAFQSSQIKETDPVTYDDAGNVIPLSERFNPENEDIRFRIGEARKEQMRQGMRTKLTTMTRADIESTISEIEKLGEATKAGGDSKIEKVAYHWVLKGSVILPEDNYKISEAIKVAEKAKVNPIDFNSPMELINSYKDFKTKEKPIDPDTVKEFSNKKELPEGIVVYDVQDDFEGQAAVRKIIDTHWGEDANPWCLAARVGGNLEKAKEYWNHYSRYPKRIAFRNGKLLAFFASASEKTWWDRNDEPHTNIPYSVKSKEGEYEVSTNYELKEGNKKGTKVSVGKSDKKGRTAYFVKGRLESAGIQDGIRNLFYNSFPAGATLTDSAYGGTGMVEVQYGPYKNVTQVSVEKRPMDGPAYFARVGYNQGYVRNIHFVEDKRVWDIRYGYNGDQIFVGSSQIIFNLNGELEDVYSGAYSMYKINDEYYEFKRGAKKLGVVKKGEKVSLEMMSAFGEDGGPVAAILDFINEMGWERSDYPYPNPNDADVLRNDAEVRDMVLKAENDINEIVGNQYLNSVPASSRSTAEQDIRFRVRGENETAEEFYQSVLDDYKAKYNTLADMVLYPINQDTADGFGLTLEELEETGAYYEIEDGEFAIFVHEDADDSLVIENAIFHESIHFVEEFYDYMRNLGKWLWENAESVDRFKEWKEYVSSKYSEDEYHKEMLAYCVADALTHGQVTEFEKVIPGEYHDIVRQLENEIGYDRRTEESRREAERILQQSGRPDNLGEQKGVQKDKESEGGLRFRATEITPEVRDEMDTIAATAIVNGNYMKAPNGADTNLTAEQWAMVRTQGFKEWFKDSKVVDENGEPRVVFHGTEEDFTAFDEEMIGENTDTGFYGRGFYFATTAEEAQGYGENVMDVFLSLQNPLDLNKVYAESDKWDGATADGAVRWWYGLASIFPEDAISETVYANIDGDEWTIADLKNRIDELAETSETPFADAAAEFGIDESFFDMMGEEDVNLPEELTDALKANGYDGVINAGAENNEMVALYPSQIKSATDNTGEFSPTDPDIRFKVVTDPAKIEELENGPKIKVYRAMQLIDGKLYPPMSAKVDGQLREPIELGQWEEAEERPDLADNKGYFKLDKGNKASLKARYNPYFHTSPTPLNDQFASAQTRPELVIVEVEVPESELTSGYKAEKAKDPVGKMEWKAGVVQSKLSGTRTVILSRWDKPIRIVPDSEVADKIVEMFEGKNIVMPSNVVTPSLREELEKRGIPFVETDNNGKPRKPGFIDVIKTLFSKGKDAAAKLYERSFFDVAKTPSFMKKLGLTGDKFTVRYGVLARHFGKDSSHDLTEKDWQKLPDALKKPFAITKLISREKDAHKDNGYRIYTTLQNSKGEYVVVGVDVKNAGRDLEVNAIATVFGRRENAHLPMNEEVIYKSKKITPEQSSLLERPNSSQYPTGQELSEGKDTDNLETANDSEENISLRVNENPTEAQKEAGNYKMGHLNLDGYRITIENPKGSVRRGTDSKGNAWENTLNNDYGYIRGTEGVDGDHIDVYLSDNPSEGNVFVIDQVNPETREFDEHKVMYGFNSAEEAREAYLANFSEGWNGLGTITEVSKDEFKKWIQSSHRKTKPFSEYKSVNAISSQSEGMVDEVMLRVTGTRTDEVVANGLSLSPAQTADLAGNIFAALPESARAEVTASLNGDILGLQDAIMQIPARLAMKENWDETDKELASVVREKVQDIVDSKGATSRPLTTKEALWMLHNTGDSYDLISAATDAIVARNLGFDPESILRRKDVEDYIRFRAGSQGAIDAATDMYNYETSLWTERLKESWLDMNQSVVALQNALTQASGMAIEPWENVVYALNRLSSKSYADKKKYLRDYLMPLWDTILDIVKHDHVSIEEIERYMKLKHALERNEIFAKRDAKEFYRGMYEEVARRMKSQSHAEKVVALSEAKKALADIDAQIATATGAKLQKLKDERVNAQYKVDVADLALRGDEKQNEKDLQDYYDNIDAGTDPKYREFREKDYGGLTSMFVDTTDVKRSDYKSEEAYQQAVLAATTPRYDDVAAMESAAEREVSLFENKVYMHKALWEKVNAATKETLRHQYESGMITVEQYEAVRDMFEFYVPLRGFADNTAEDMYSYYMNNSSNGFSMPIIGAKGRKTRAESPLGWIGTMAESAIQADNKNEAKMCLYYAVLRRPDQNLLSITDTWFEYSHTENGKKVYKPAYPPKTDRVLNADELRQHMEDWEKDMKSKQAQGKAFKGTQAVNLRGSVIFQDDKQEKEHIIRVKVAGKDYSILINGNPRAAQAINGLLNPDANVGPVREWIGWARRGLSSLLTSFSPLFWVANYQRDLLSSTMRTSEAYGWGDAKRYLANRRKAWRVASYIYKYQDGTLGDSYYENLYKEFAENGGITGYTALTTNKEYEKLLEDYAKEVNNPEAIKWAKNAFGNFMSFGEAIEQVSRFAAFITARESGMGIEEAVNAAKEVSVNFNRKGSAQPISREELDKLRTKDGKKLNGAQRIAAIVLSAMPSWLKELYFFFNASVQAISSSVKLAAKSPDKAAGWAGAYFGMSIAMAWINYLLGDDDDDEYLDLPDYLRHSTVLIKVSDGYYIKWSIPQEMRPFYAWADMLVSKMMGKMPHKNLGKEMALAAAQWLPVNPFEAEDPLLSLVPDVASPIVEAMANKTSFGGKIYDDMAFKSEGTVKDIPAYRKATDKTGKVYVELSEILNTISGGDEVKKGKINVNPAAIEHLVEGYGGGIYDFAKMMVTFPGMVLDAVTGENEMEIKNIPFLNKVVMSVDETNMYSHTNDAFYHYKGIAESAKRIEKEYAESDDPSRAEAYRKEEDWRIYLLYKQYEKDFKDVKERLDNAVDDTETDLLKQEQNVLREMFLNDIAKGELPEVTFEIREDIKRIEKDVKKIMKPADDANKERLERKKAGDVDGMVRAIERRDSLKDTPEYQRAEEISKEVKAIKKQLQELGTVERKSQRDSVIGELQRNYERLKERMSDEISQLP